MSDNSVVDLKGSDGSTYRGILKSHDEITSYQTWGGPDKAKLTRHYYELEDGRRTATNRFGEHVIIGTNITLNPV